MVPTTERADAIKSKNTDEVVALAITPAQDASACDSVDGRGASSKRKDISTDGYLQDELSSKHRERTVASRVDIAVKERRGRLGLVPETAPMPASG